MSAAESLCSGAIRRIGGTAILMHDSNRLTFTASIQPRRESGGEDAGARGTGQESLFTMYAPAGTAAEKMRPGDSVEFRGGRYFVLRAEPFCFAGEPAYYWAVLRREQP